MEKKESVHAATPSPALQSGEPRQRQQTRGLPARDAAAAT